MAIWLPRTLTDQPRDSATVDQSSAFAKQLTAALLPTASGYADGSVYRNDCRSPIGSPAFLTSGPKLGQAFDFTSSDGWLGGSSTPALSSADGFSIAIWINFNASVYSYSQIISRDAGSGNDWAIFANATTPSPVWGWNGSAAFAATSSPGGWHLWHLTISASGNAVWYLDGVQDATASSVSIRSANGALRISKRVDGYGNNSRVGRVYVWNRVCSPGEAALLFRNEWQLFRAPPRRLFVVPAAGTGSTGTVAATNANDTLAAAGKTTIIGTVAKTNANDTSAAAGTTTVTGALAKTNANDSSTASGTTTVTGTVAKTNANDTLAATGSVGAGSTGTLATTNANDTSAGVGSTTVQGALSRTNVNDTLAASGSVGSGGPTGTLAKTNANDASAAAGSTTVTGSLARTNAADTSAAAGTTTVVGSLSRTNANDSVAASGAAGTVTGTVSVTNANDTSTSATAGGAGHGSRARGDQKRRVAIEAHGRIWTFESEEDAEVWLRADQPALEKQAQKVVARAVRKAVAAPELDLLSVPAFVPVRAVSGPASLKALVSMQSALLKSSLDQSIKHQIAEEQRRRDDEEEDAAAFFLMME